MTTKTGLFLVFALLAGFAIVACESDSGQSAGLGSGCEPGESRSCTCPDGSGSQKICGDSGSGYHPCQCADVVVDPGDSQGDVAGSDTSMDVVADIPLDGCAPDCAGKQCGSNGCGGQCGSCDGGSICDSSGQCVGVACGGAPTTISGALVTELGAVDFDSVSVAVIHKRDVDPYEDGCIVEIRLDFYRGDGCHFQVTAGEMAASTGALAIQQMMLSADSQCPGFPDGKEGTYYVKGDLVLGDIGAGLVKVPDANASASCFHSTMRVRLAGVIHNAEQNVDLNLAQSVIEINGDFNSQGSMSAHCPCVFSCDGKTCGSDGCGGVCGVCGCGEECDGGACRFVNCDGLECGDDGCGGSCGVCNEWPGGYCMSGGQCGCEASCSGKQCGDNGCGGPAGTARPERAARTASA